MKKGMQVVKSAEEDHTAVKEITNTINHVKLLTGKMTSDKYRYSDNT